MEILRYLNWVDILIAGILVRVIYIGFKNGFIIELFKVLTVVFAIFVALHYFSSLGHFFHAKLGCPARFATPLALGLLWSVVAIVFKLIRDGLLLFIRVEMHSSIDKWGGLVIASFRGVLVVSLTLVLLGISGFPYVEKTARTSLSYTRIASLAPGVYQRMYNGLVSKFFPSEKLNQNIQTLYSVEKNQK